MGCRADWTVRTSCPFVVPVRPEGLRVLKGIPQSAICLVKSKSRDNSNFSASREEVLTRTIHEHTTCFRVGYLVRGRYGVNSCVCHSTQCFRWPKRL